MRGYTLLYYKILLSVVQIIKGNCLVLQLVLLFPLLLLFLSGWLPASNVQRACKCVQG